MADARPLPAGHRLWLPVAAMAGVITLSNVAVNFQINDWLTWGAFTYPLAFLVTDLTNRALGAEPARRVVYAGFAVGVACSIVAGLLGLSTVRIALASGAAFLIAQLLDILIFDRLRRHLAAPDAPARLNVKLALAGVLERQDLRSEAVTLLEGELEAASEAQLPMLGRTPSGIRAIRPIKDGVIADFEITEAMLRYFIQRAHNRRKLVRPRVVICVPPCITSVEKRASTSAACSSPMASVSGVKLARSTKAIATCTSCSPSTRWSPRRSATAIAVVSATAWRSARPWK